MQNRCTNAMNHATPKVLRTYRRVYVYIRTQNQIVIGPFPKYIFPVTWFPISHTHSDKEFSPTTTSVPFQFRIQNSYSSSSCPSPHRTLIPRSTRAAGSTRFLSIPHPFFDISPWRRVFSRKASPPRQPPSGKTSSHSTKNDEKEISH